MNVILLERIEKLGQMGDVVTVKPGYARNYLLPQKKALRASKQNVERFEQERVQLEAANLERRSEAESVAGKLAGLSITLIRQAGESGQLYGSVNSRDVTEAVVASGTTIERQQVVQDRVIKSLGLHEVKIRLHPEVTVSITANVARSEEEATTQAATGRMVSSQEQQDVEEAREAEIEAVVEAVEAEEAETEAAAAEADGADEAAAEEPAKES